MSPSPVDPRWQVALVAVAWCLLHSLPIVPGVERRLRRLLGRRAAWFRLGYNLLSLVTLIAAWAFFRSHPGRPLWRWHDGWRVLQVMGWLVFLWLGWAGTRAHDGGDFLGLRQIRAARTGTPEPPPRLSREGVLGMVRHPWYASGLAFLLVYRDFTTTDVVWRSIFALYLLVGAWWEERKLLARFGDAYAAYRREVPAFLPDPRRLIGRLRRR